MAWVFRATSGYLEGLAGNWARLSEYLEFAG
jgi:hypothetical protein